jgi:glycyl-tRNA synthetase beta subunit
MVAAWPKLMRWDVENSSIQPKWIRPIRNIACLFGGEIIEVEFAGLKSNDQTFGHFLKSFEPLKLKDASDYKKTLSQNFVILDRTDRRKKTQHHRRCQHDFAAAARIIRLRAYLLTNFLLHLCQ